MTRDFLALISIGMFVASMIANSFNPAHALIPAILSVTMACLAIAYKK